MGDNVDNKTLQTLLEEAKRQGRKEGMADLFAALSLADGREQQGYFVFGGQQLDGKTIFQNRIDKAMMNAAKQNQIELVLFLLKAGAHANSRNEEGLTALQCAVQEGHIEVVKALLAARADPNLTFTRQPVTPLACAVKLSYAEIVKALLKAGADVHNGKEPARAAWLINYTDKGDKVEITRELLKHGAFIGPDEDDELWTPLMFAVCNGNTESSALLIKAGSDVNAQGDAGETALMIAAESYGPCRNHSPSSEGRSRCKWQRQRWLHSFDERST